MLQDWLLLIVSLGYLGLLFAVAYYGDRQPGSWRGGARESAIYALSLAIYCTSWTFYGSVGRAATNGADFLLIYLGPVLMIVPGYPLMRKIIDVSQAQNVTSIADFIGARYGKSRPVAALAATIAVIGILPYIALQLQAVSQSFEVLAQPTVAATADGHAPFYRDTALYVAFTMAVFSILFGVRHVQASERHEGMILAIAFESLVKLAAFIAAGAFVVFGMFDGLPALLELAARDAAVRAAVDASQPSTAWIALTVASAFAFICLPRQFQVAFVAAGRPENLRTATWLFPAYLVAINLFVPAIAAAGLVLTGSAAGADGWVLTLPLAADQPLLSVFVFIGGLSAATSMVIVASVALSTMVCNELVVPALIGRLVHPATDQDLGELLLRIRRIAIFVILFLAYVYYLVIGGRYPLASIGLISFCAVSQFAPALIAGLYWRRAHRHGVFAGLLAGLTVWTYGLFIPTFEPGGGPVLPDVFGVDANSVTRGLFWSLLVNVSLFVAISLVARQRERDVVQAEAFVQGHRRDDAPGQGKTAPATPIRRELEALAARFVGAEATERAFAEAPDEQREKALAELTERLLSGAIGAASARIVVTAALRRRGTARADLSVLDQASEAILASRDLLRSTLESVRLGIGVFDDSLRLAAWNRRFVDLLALDGARAHVGTSLEAIVHATGAPDSVDVDLGQIAADQRDPATRGTNRAYERRRADGMVLDIQTTPMPAGGFVLVLTDVTERVRAAELLRDGERRIRVYTDNVPVLMAYVDRDERYRFTNHAYEAALGLTRERTFGMSIREALGDQRYAMLKPDIDAAFRGEKRVFELELPSGREMRLYLGAYIPHVDDRGEVAGFFTLYQDITEQREAESILREAKATLEKRVAERTRDLTRLNEQLGEAKASAEAANLGKTRFLAAASHDLLQPLHAARLFSASLAEAPLEGRSKDIVGQIEQALGAVDELLRALLDISKLDAGGLRPDLRAFVLGDVFEGLAGSFAPVAGNRDVDFRIVPTRLTIESDPTLLRRILQNFLANALRYAKGGKVLLGCRRRGGEVRIDVWDTGPGIPEDKRVAIFEEFHRLEEAEDGGPPGLGLGLAIVERIARMLDHRIELRSWPGRGSVFSVIVPLAAKKAAPAKAAFRPQRAARGSLVGRMVLAIDNDRAILEGMRALFEGWSSVALVATDVAEARRVLAAHGGPPDIVLIDHHLGGGETGFDALDALADALPRDVPTVLITANRTDEVRDLARARRVPILLKPVRPAALRALVTQLVAPAAETVAAE